VLLWRAAEGRQQWPFVVLTTQRSGSSWLLNVLHGLELRGAALKVTSIEPVKRLLSTGVDLGTSWGDYGPLLNRAFEDYAGCDLEKSRGETADVACGSKLMYNQIPGTAVATAMLEDFQLVRHLSQRFSRFH